MQGQPNTVCSAGYGCSKKHQSLDCTSPEILVENENPESCCSDVTINDQPVSAYTSAISVQYLPMTPTVMMNSTGVLALHQVGYYSTVSDEHCSLPGINPPYASRLRSASTFAACYLSCNMVVRQGLRDKS